MGASAPFRLDDNYAREFPELVAEWTPSPAASARALALNDALASELGLDPARLAEAASVDVLAGSSTLADSHPVAQAYSGHQFGGFSPRLGDGRAVLLGELVTPDGTRRDLHLKGSGHTVFARGGDGKAAVGPMLREYVISEAMHALGVPTTRALAVVATGEQVVRERLLPGAVLARVASSHLRVGTFQYAAVHHGPEVVRRLADHAIARHHPSAVGADEPYAALLESVLRVQAELVAKWMNVGFIHGVMNTDNTTISGETIDYGPCAFMERYDPATVFSSIDTGGRYAYGNQPAIVQWNLARLAETLLPLIDTDIDRAVERATGILQGFPEIYGAAWLSGMRAKLGLVTERPDDAELVDALLATMLDAGLDFTSFYRSLPSVLGGTTDSAAIVQWQERVADERRTDDEVRAAMDSANPVYIPRNHLVEEALEQANDDSDLTSLEGLLEAVRRPFEERAGLERFAEPAPPDFGRYRTFCGT